MSNDKIIAGGQSPKQKKQTVIAGQKAEKPAPEIQEEASTIEERIAKSTETGGLTGIPNGFDDADGDWKIIHSSNPFEVLYLDYKQYLFIKQDIVKNNYDLLHKFWQDKTVQNMGGNRVAFRNKYGDGTIEQSLQRLKSAYNKLNSQEKLEIYFNEINAKRLKNGEEAIRSSIEQMLVDNVAEHREIQFCLEKGAQNGLSKDETAQIINRYLTEGGFYPYGEVEGNNIVDKLLSVNSWLTKEELEKAEKEREERERHKIRVLPERYANTIEEIGQILFEDEAKACEYINNDLIKSTVAQKDIVIASQIADISKSSDSIGSKYLQIVYKLNPRLPYRVRGGLFANDVKELCSILYRQENMKLGKEHLKKGLIEVWLRETDKISYNKFVEIRDSAENLNLAYLEFLYTFDKSLPYRLAGDYEANSPEELFDLINMNNNTWKWGKQELFDSSILIWLIVRGESKIISKWNRIKKDYEDELSDQDFQDLLLEKFLLLLNENAKEPRLKASMSKVKYMSVQSGKTVQTKIDFTNTTRGYAMGTLVLSREIEGVELSKSFVAFNSAEQKFKDELMLEIDTSNLKKGVVYNTEIVLETTAAQTITIPVRFKVVFPRNAFILQALKYAAIVAFFFGLTRYLLSLSYPEWLSYEYDYYLDMTTARFFSMLYFDFIWPFLVFAALILISLHFYIKYLRRL